MKNKEVDRKIREAIKYFYDCKRTWLIFSTIENLAKCRTTSAANPSGFSIEVAIEDDYVISIKLLRDNYIKMWKINDFPEPIRTINFYISQFVPSKKFIKYIKKKNNLTNKEINEIVNKELFKCI